MWSPRVGRTTTRLLHVCDILRPSSYKGLFSGFSGCRYLDRSTTVYPSSEPVLWHSWFEVIDTLLMQLKYPDALSRHHTQIQQPAYVITTRACMSILSLWFVSSAGYTPKAVLIWGAQNTSTAKEYLSGMHILGFASAKIYRWLTYSIARGVNSIVK